MNKKFSIPHVLVGSIVWVASAHPTQAALPSAPAAPPPVQHIFMAVLTALKNDDYAGFVADAEAPFKAALTKPMLAQVNAQLSPRLKGGYRTLYLGKLSQKGYQVYLWKLTYTDGGDDSLASLSLKAGKIGGFFIN